MRAYREVVNPQRPEPHSGPEVHDVHSITAARSPRSVDQSVRARRYLISMSIRTVCVVGAVVVGGPLRWVFIAGALGLPYVAVVMANAVGSGQPRPSGGRRPVHRIALPQEADVRVAEERRPDAGPERRSAEWTKFHSGNPSS